MSDAVDIFECDGCGLCCKGLLVEAYPLDVAREPRIEQAVPLKRSKEHPLYILESCWILMTPDISGCPFLSQDNRCGIYATRPNACVGFPAGGEKCQSLRRANGLEELKPLKRANDTMSELMSEMVATSEVEWE